MKTLFVIDIDGTITQAGWRFAKAGKEPSRDDRAVYGAWVRAVQNEETLLADKAVLGMREMVANLSYYSEVVYLTSRENQWRDVTRQWLQKHGFPLLPLIMRPEDDYREGADFKEAAIITLCEGYKSDSVVVIDDDERGTIEAMCHRNGYTFLKARSGGTK